MSEENITVEAKPTSEMIEKKVAAAEAYKEAKLLKYVTTGGIVSLIAMYGLALYSVWVAMVVLVLCIVPAVIILKKVNEKMIYLNTKYQIELKPEGAKNGFRI